jgi:hypothetical protein
MRKVFGIGVAAFLGTIAAVSVLGLIAIWDTDDKREGLLVSKVIFSYMFLGKTVVSEKIFLQPDNNYKSTIHHMFNVAKKDRLNHLIFHYAISCIDIFVHVQTCKESFESEVNYFMR